MPEIGEVARVVHFLNKHLVKRTISSVIANEDDIVYGKVGCSASAFKESVEGRRVTGAAQQGKYFYITLDKPPHPLLHFGMTGWMKFDCEETLYYRQAKVKPEDLEWPPKYAKFLLKCEAETVDGEQKDAVEVAFVDPRRLARIRLVDCEAEDIRKVEPLSKNGPDPVVDKEKFTLDFLTTLLRKKKVPVKALLLDQANVSGIGNWVADEVMYQARLHPEQYSNTFDDDQIKRIYDAVTTVCGIACGTLAVSTQFPETWLMKYRWDKGKKDSNVLPDGNKIVHLKVGGRTSAIVPAVQKKTAAVAGDVDVDGEKVSGSKRKAKDAESDDDVSTEPKPKRRSRGLRAKQVRALKARDAATNGGAEAEEESTSIAKQDAEDAEAAQEKTRTPRNRTSVGKVTAAVTESSTKLKSRVPVKKDTEKAEESTSKSKSRVSTKKDAETSEELTAKPKSRVSAKKVAETSEESTVKSKSRAPSKVVEATEESTTKPKSRAATKKDAKTAEESTSKAKSRASAKDDVKPAPDSRRSSRTKTK